MNPGKSQHSQDLMKLQRPIFLWSLPFIFLYFGLPIISKDLGASGLEIGGLFSVFTGATLILRPVVGWLIDRFDRKLFFVSALMIYACAMGIFAFASSLSTLYFARAVQGIGSAILWTVTNTIVADLTSQKDRGKAFGQINQTISRGGLVGVLAASILLFVIPNNDVWKYAFIGFTILTTTAAFMAWKILPMLHPHQNITTDKPVITGKLIKLLIIVFITAVPEAMLSPIYLTYLQDKFTTDIMTLAWAFFPAGLITAFYSAKLGGFSDRFGPFPMLALGMVGAGIVSLFMPFLPTIFWLMLLYAITTIFLGLSEPAETALVAEFTGNDKRGKAYGLYDFVENLGFTIGPVLGGLLYDLIGTKAPFILNGIILIASSGLVLLFFRKNPDKKPGVKSQLIG